MKPAVGALTHCESRSRTRDQRPRPCPHLTPAPACSAARCRAASGPGRRRRYLDGKVWLESSEFAVRLLLSLIHHVTGVRLKAFFTTTPAAEPGGLLRCAAAGRRGRAARRRPSVQSSASGRPVAFMLVTAHPLGVAHARGTPVQGAYKTCWLFHHGSHCERRGAADAGARGRPDKPALCGLFERHDGSMHCLRIRGIRRAPSRPERAAAVSLRAPGRGVEQVLGLMTRGPHPLRCVVRTAACSMCAVRAPSAQGGRAGQARGAGPRMRRRRCCGLSARWQGPFRAVSGQG